MDPTQLLWIIPGLIAAVGTLITILVKYFMSTMTKSVLRVEEDIKTLCEELRKNYMPRTECEAHRNAIEYKLHNH